MDKHIRKRKSDIPPCKYGSSCYQKNPDHHKKYSHPSEAKKESNTTCVNSTVNADSPQQEVKMQNNKPGFIVITNNGNTSTLKETVKTVLESMPEDFVDFWSFCSAINKKKPEDAFISLGLKLVGTFDLISRDLPPNQEIDLSCHYRFYYDPPEFQTVITDTGKEQYHIGYFRDDPNQKPSILASNDAALGCKLTLKGDNIFAAINTELKDRIPKLKNKKEKDNFLKIQKDLIEFATEKNYKLDLQTAKTKARTKKVVSKTFHGLGIVVPVVNDIGYRPLPDSDATIKKIFKKITDAKTEEERLIEEEALDEIIMNVNLGNDECDFGMGLELGIDLFCNGGCYFHSHMMNLLTLAYKLLKRQKYADIVTAHLKDRRKENIFNVFE